MELLSLNDLSQIVNVPESTVDSWTDAFQVFIPKSKKQGELYYLPEAVDVLLSIKEYYDMDYSKSEIMKFLADRSFPKKDNNPTEDNQAKKGTHKENLVTMMQTIGKTVANVASQDKLIQTVKEQQSKQNQRIKIIEKQAEEIDDLKLEMKQIRHEHPSPDTYQQKKQAFSRLFNRADLSTEN